MSHAPVTTGFVRVAGPRAIYAWWN